MKELFRGIKATEGKGTGRVRIIDCSCPEYEDRIIEDTDRELGRFVRALKTFCNNTRSEIEYIKRTIGAHESDILLGHIQMTHDPKLQSELINKINNGMCAERATSEICDEYIKRFMEADVEFLRQIATDVKDVKTGVINLLLHKEPVNVEDFGEDTIVVSKEMTPSVIARLDREHTKGIITEIGSSDSHGAALARAMKIPSIVKIPNIDKLLKDGDYITLDADEGIVYSAE
jgi:phosphotransferase system enzyme I (PtsI)